MRGSVSWSKEPGWLVGRRRPAGVLTCRGPGPLARLLYLRGLCLFSPVRSAGDMQCSGLTSLDCLQALMTLCCHLSSSVLGLRARWRVCVVGSWGEAADWAGNEIL